MAFVRRVKTASGATAVQIAEYADGGQRIVKHFGSARTDAELGVLMEQARHFLIDRNQLVLDIDTPVSATDLLGPPSTPTLFGQLSYWTFPSRVDELSCVI